MVTTFVVVPGVARQYIQRMSPIPALAIADLVLLVAAASLGLASLLGWLRHPEAAFPTAKAVTHLALQLVAIAVWVAFVVSGAVAAAWAAFVIITLGQVFGDLLMFASYRARRPGVAQPGYLAVGGDVLSFRRPVPAMHALVGALAWFGMLAICIAATVIG